MRLWQRLQVNWCNLKPKNLFYKDAFLSWLKMFYLQSTGNELSRCDEACSIKFQAINDLFVLRKRTLKNNVEKEHEAKHRKPTNKVLELKKVVMEEIKDGKKLKTGLRAGQHFLRSKKREIMGLTDTMSKFDIEASWTLDIWRRNRYMKKPKSHSSRFADFISKSGHDLTFFIEFSVKKLPDVKEKTERNNLLYIYT